MDVKPASQEKLWQAVRSVDPSPSARVRVLARLEAELEPSRSRRSARVPRVVFAIVLVLVAGSAAAAAGVHWWRIAHPMVADSVTTVVPKGPAPADSVATAVPKGPAPADSVATAVPNEQTVVNSVGAAVPAEPATNSSGAA